ncbi:uncharacterized protein H6S33_010809 [Morchella sextelata]|uniref:uncharacterized protein n=1 Tax=Morchella sextelata TaxID=1174677 RepID=UPI001D04D717|nr:uncharacterized protein H6S33_010809 [Morchella sextelata]KAH0611544.1 hypothetical protein H6S33_010809 [Morchella sextelata]
MKPPSLSNLATGLCSIKLSLRKNQSVEYRFTSPPGMQAEDFKLSGIERRYVFRFLPSYSPVFWLLLGCYGRVCLVFSSTHSLKQEINSLASRSFNTITRDEKKTKAYK